MSHSDPSARGSRQGQDRKDEAERPGMQGPSPRTSGSRPLPARDKDDVSSAPESGEKPDADAGDDPAAGLEPGRM